MIIFPQALVISEAAAGTPLTHGRIGYQTLTKGGVPSQVTVSSESAAGPADAPLRPETYEYWEPTALTATWLYNWGTIETVNYVGIAGHTIGSVGASIKAETSQDGVNWSALSTEHVPSDDSPIMFLDDDRDATQMRLTLQGVGAVMPKIAAVYVGLTLDLYRAIYGGHSPLSLSRDTVHQSNVSRGGQFLGQTIQSMGVSGNVRLNNLPAAWYRSNFDPFVEEARSRPYFYAWRPQTYPLEVVYLWNVDDLSPSNMGKRDFMEVSWRVRGIGWVRNG